MSTTTMTATGGITLEQALPIIDAAGIAGIPVLLRGGSGIGKSSALATLAHARNEHLEVVTASLYEASDFGGLPFIDSGQVRLAPFPWVRRVVAADRPSCVFFDEVNGAAPPVQNALLRVLLEAAAGDTDLPAGTRFVAAMNPTRASAGGWDLPAPVAGRFLHLDITTDADAWVTGMLSGWSLTPTRVTCDAATPEAAAAALGRVTAFITANPHLLNVQPDDPASAAGAWPSGRKWDWVARILPMLPAAQDGDDVDLQLAAVEGLVGRVAADEFFTYLERVQLPATADVLADPDVVDWEDGRPEQVQAVLTGLVAAAASDPGAYATVGHILTRVVGAGRADLAASVAKAYLGTAPAGVAPDADLLSSLFPLLARAGKIR